MTATGTPPADSIKSLLRRALELTECPGRTELLAQVDGVEYVDGPVTMMNLHVDRVLLLPASRVSSPVQLSPQVRDESGEVVGGLLLWLDDTGYIDCLEYWWVSDEMPTELPPPERLATS